MKRLSELKNIEFNEEQVNKIVFSDIKDSGKSCDYAFVFGHTMLIKERTLKAIEMYKAKRVKKLVFLGGGYGDSNNSNNHIPESHQMRDMAINIGIPTEDILIEDHSTNTYENIVNGLNLLSELKLNKIMLITGEFHLKRCKAILQKLAPNIEPILISAKDNINDKEVWHMHDNVWNNNGKHGSAKSLVINEAKILVKGAIQGTMADLLIDLN
jgi:uncharacterized SAM-binding protein YcdF (DUF218 family)